MTTPKERYDAAAAANHDALQARIAQDLRSRFGIGHATIQIETGDPAHPCPLEPDGVV